MLFRPAARSFRPRRRKVRHVRSEEAPHDLVVVVRASPANRVAAAEEMAAAAVLSAEAYVIERDDGSRELLYGVSVYARRPGADPDVLERFSATPAYLAAAVGRLRAAGFPLLPTGTHPEPLQRGQVAGAREEDMTGMLNV